MDLTRISHNELIDVLVRDCRNEKAWGEFIKRFNNFIALVIIRECQYLHYSEGLNQIEDLVNMVYLKLLDKDCKALKVFKHRYENAIFKYLRIIAVRTVLIQFTKNRAHKRAPKGGKTSLDLQAWNVPRDRRVDLKEILPENHWDANLKVHELIEEINYCLEKILQKNKNAERDKLIFKYYMFGDFEVKEITQFPNILLSEKRISNLISELKENVRKCLKSRGISG